MPTAVQVQCPAKVNLFLEITGKRRNGYHSLATIFAKINLFDVLEAEAAPEGLSLEIVDEIGQGLSASADNLILRAAAAFRKIFGLKLGARFRLIKRIPMGAGLGGGSSDAAGAMTALSRLYRIEPAGGKLKALRAAAAALGADIPFFLRRDAFCLGLGIGEKLTPLPSAKALPWMVLVYPNVFVSTRDVYGRLTIPGPSDCLTRLAHLDKIKIKLEKGRPISEWGDLLFNRLEEGVLGQVGEVRQAKEILQKLSCAPVLMSGSGSSVFGFVGSQKEAEKAAALLKGYPWKVFTTCCLG